MNHVSLLVRRLAAGCLPAAMICCIGGCPVNPGIPDPGIPDPTQTIPEITNPLVQGELAEGQSTTITVSATVVDPGSTVMSVVADLTKIGGQPARALEPGDSNLWTWTGDVTPSASGTQQVTFVATNAQGRSTSVSVDVAVAVRNTGPQITNLAATGSLTQDQPSDLSISVHVADAEGTVEQVTVDLTEIGGDSAQPLTAGDGDIWTFSGTLTPTVEGTRTITFTAIDDQGDTTTTTTSVVVVAVIVLDGPPVVFGVEGLPDDRKITPGAGLGKNDLTRVQMVMVQEVPSGQVTLEIASGAEKIAIWKNANRGEALTLPQTWDLAADKLPSEIHVEGLALSDAAQDVELIVSYDNPQAVINADSLSDSLHFTIVDVQRNSLGYDMDLEGMNIGKVQIPTRYGGRLSVGGANVQLIYTDGSDLSPSMAGRIFQGGLDSAVVGEGDPGEWTVPEGAQGWCYIRLLDGGPATIWSDFVEEGEASYRPWNGWWWPFLQSSGPTLYDFGGPMDKYDQVYGTAARSWEETNQAYGQYWFGHCWGWSIAAILIPEPQAVTKNGVDFTSDDVKGLYTELADCDPYFDQSLSIPSMPAMPCTGSSGEAIDQYCDDYYRILRTCVRDEGVPLQSDMRAIDSPPNLANEVWNQSVYSYAASFSELDAEAGVFRVFLQVWSNFGPYPPPTGNGYDRYEEFVFYLQFDAAGQLIPESADQNWVSASHYPPENLYRLTGSPWAPRNPYITKSQIDGLYAP